MKNNTKMKALLATVFAALFALFMVACSGGQASSGSASASASSASASAASASAASASASAASESASTSSASASAASASASSAATPASADVVRISTTTSVNDSGLLPYLQPYFEAATGYKWEVSSAGTGAAIQAAKDGNADALLVHSKSQEEEFISEGYATERIPFMYNYFVIVGPADDPAGIKSCATASEAFAKIAQAKQPFVSRADKSGTHTKELGLWEAAGIDPAGQEWYFETGQGMGATLTQAAERQGYTLSDKATFLSNDAKNSLTILLGESEDMKNTYSLLEVSSSKYPDNNIEGAKAFVQWMQSEEADKLIAEYGTSEYGEPLFFLM
ncbi:MAG TPA: tungsten ABC transporter substrate-binding protein [Eggerthellaceae bacterium]|nr:tungsten ABC transporter substrate-binding protein [Eggerthellaceae bacterium]